MNLKERLICRLKTAREFSEKLLADFKTPEQWTHQVHPNSNHALWFAVDGLRARGGRGHPLGLQPCLLPQ